MVDPVNLNVPGFPYLLFALVFLAVVIAFTGILAPIELAIRRRQRSSAGDESETDPEDDALGRSDLLFGRPRLTGVPNGDARTTVYECRRCGTTLDAGTTTCPVCETRTVARYEIE